MKKRKRVISKELLDEILLAGTMMSNICANVSQESWEVTDRNRKRMADCYRRWDEVLRKVREVEEGKVHA
jgi:hypothetical protein